MTAVLDQPTGQPQEPRSGGRRAEARTAGAAADAEHVVVGSSFMLTLFSPLILLIDLLVLIGSRGSVFTGTSAMATAAGRS
jgi:lipopolysaccharide/colanic/teichoic acid biosynthesis glycosyltransferase